MTETESALRQERAMKTTNPMIPPVPAGWSGRDELVFHLGDCEACFVALCELRGRLLRQDRRTA